MNGFLILAVCIVLFVVAYATYGAWLCKKWGVDPTRKTPAVEKNDGGDYVPTSTAVVLGHHFASIAGAGPITGPINAAFFGWVPVLLWIVLGGIFFGGVQDFSALFASIRHDGKTMSSLALSFYNNVMKLTAGTGALAKEGLQCVIIVPVVVLALIITIDGLKALRAKKA